MLIAAKDKTQLLCLFISGYKPTYLGLCMLKDDFSKQSPECIFFFLGCQFRGGTEKPEEVSFRSFCPFYEKHLS